MLRHWAERAGELLEQPRKAPQTRSFEVVKSEFFRQALPYEAVTALAENVIANRATGQSREVDFSPWGGAYNRIPAQATAFVHRNSLFWIKHSAAVPAQASTDDRAAAHSWAHRSLEMVHRFGDGGVFPNFPDPDFEDWGRESWARPRRVWPTNSPLARCRCSSSASTASRQRQTMRRLP